jgi:N-acetylglucosaminyl-diphospho-decaprenol L-rhamnosyltransferase
VQIGIVTWAVPGAGFLDTRPDLPLVVVSDGDAHVPGARVLPVGERLARAAAVNRGVVALPGADWVAVADPRIEWSTGLLDALAGAAVRHPRAGVIGPRIRAADGSVLPSAGSLPGRRDLRRRRLPLGAPRSTGPVGWVAGTCLLLRRAAWDSVDGFDARHLGPADAVDLGARLRRAGWLAVHVPGAEVVVGPGPATGMLESVDSGLRRYAQDRREQRYG